MTTFYHKLNFDLSQEAKDWVLNRYRERLKVPVWHDFDITQYTPQSQREWQESPVGIELRKFLSIYGADTSFFGISAFISNVNEYYVGNPHIDSTLDKDLNVGRMKTRFNVMVLGNKEDPMLYWPNIDYDDPCLTSNQYEDIDKRKFQYTKSIPGKTKEDRLKFVGSPEFEIKNLLEPSAFIKVDCAHTVNVSPGPRIIVTVALDKTIEELLNCTRITNS
jgi:hypothetical protein